MAFWQLYYTSCRDGMLGQPGFQFAAVTPGVPPATMSAVEDLTVYRPPRSMPADPAPGQLDQYPVAFMHQPDVAGHSITAQVSYLGRDFSQRPGNYFAHALVAGSAADFGGLLAVELWQAPCWQTRKDADRELVALISPPAPGCLNPASVAEFLARQDARLWPALLSATTRAMAGGRPVLLVGTDTAACANWIAAACYGLGDQFARRLSFTTYSHKPDREPHHLIGVRPEQADALDPGAFQVFDPTVGGLAGPVYPLAELLARSAPANAGALWKLAAELAPDRPDGFSQWYPSVAAAAALTETPLVTADQEAALAWLATAELVPQAVRVSLKLLSRPPDSWPACLLIEVLAAARRLESSVLLERAEVTLVGLACERLTLGKPPPDAVRLDTALARQTAVERCVRLLGGLLPPAQAVELLTWAATAQLSLPAESLLAYGEHDLALNTDSRVLDRLLGGWPDLRAGFVRQLATAPEAASQLLGSSAALSYRDLAGHRELAELWLLAGRDRGELGSIEALGRIRSLRAAGHEADAGLLSRLWPDGCPVTDLRALLKLSAEADPEGSRGWQDWLVAAVSGVLTSGSGHDRLRLAATLERYPELTSRLPPTLAGVAAGWSALALVRSERPVLARIYRAYPLADREAQRWLRAETCDLLGQVEDLGSALVGCPPGIRRTFCARAAGQLRDPRQADGVPGIPKFARLAGEQVLAARIFLAMARLRDRGNDVGADDLAETLGWVTTWPRSWLRDLRSELGENAAAFNDWLSVRKRRKRC